MKAILISFSKSIEDAAPLISERQFEVNHIYILVFRVIKTIEMTIFALYL